MAIKVTTTWRNDNPNAIWNKLAAKLGREPTSAEAREEVERIMSDVHCKAAEDGNLRYQRGLLP